MNNKEKKQQILIVLLILNLVATCCIIGYLALGNRQETNTVGGILADQMETGEKYILYIGTNDKDTYQQEIPTEEARDMVNAICAKYVGGYTASDAKGGWVDETDTLTQENTLVYSFYEITEEQLVQVMDDILKQLNQNSILVERQEAVYTYYYGNK